MISGLIARMRSLWNGITGGRRVDADMQAEFEHHIELRAAEGSRWASPSRSAPASWASSRS